MRTVQHGLGERGPRSTLTGQLVCGDETLSDEELLRNRVEISDRDQSHPLDTEVYAQRRADLSKIDVPLLSAANWGGQGLHLRGNIEGFLQSGSERKWLEVHGGEHWTSYYTRYGVDIQKSFFGQFLKGENTGWDDQPPVLLQVRHIDRFESRAESEWPINRTRWTKFYLDLGRRALSLTPPVQPASRTFEALGAGARFFSEPFPQETEITGPLAAKLFASSSTVDADVFLVLGLFDPEGKEFVFQGALDPHTPVAQGWLRASHRKLDPARSLPYRPYHPHDERQMLTPGVAVELDVEIWPTSIVVPSGWRIGLSVLGRDYEYEGEAAHLSNMKYPMKGCGPFVHDDPEDRPVEIFGGATTLHASPEQAPFLLLPVIPRA